MRVVMTEGETADELAKRLPPCPSCKEREVQVQVDHRETIFITYNRGDYEDHEISDIDETVECVTCQGCGEVIYERRSDD